MFNWYRKSAVAEKVAPESNAVANHADDSNTQLAISESEALKNQGNVHLGNGKLEDAAECFRQAIERNPGYAEAYTSLGFVFRLQGNLEEAVALCRKAVSINPNLLAAHLNLGVALMGLEQGDAAEESFRRVVALAPEHSAGLQLSVALQSLGVIATQRGDLPQAELLLRRALELQPDYVDAHYILGNLFLQARRLPEAEASYRCALELKPDYADVHVNLGNTLKERGLIDEAEASYRRAVQIKPNYAEAHSNLGALLVEANRLPEAEASYRRALELKPDYADAHYNFGEMLMETNRLPEAEASYRRALQIKPDYAEAHYNLGNTLMEAQRLPEAEASYRHALELKPDYAEARWILAIARIPQIAGAYEEISASREKLFLDLSELNAWFDADRTELGYKAVGALQPFYLAYQEENNRDFLFQYGTLCARLMKHWQDRQTFPSPSIAMSGAIRVGIVSAHIHSHSVWDAIVKGWFQHLDRDRIELHIFHVGNQQDGETGWAKSHSTSFAQGKKRLAKWVEIILEKHVDVLIYPEIGMDPMTVKLASLRLVKIQIAAWGHPETTGLPTMDYYLSAEYLEPIDAQNNYTEQLVLLPHLGCHYHPAQVTSDDPDFRRFGIDFGVPLFLCPGAPFKYAPRHDHVLVDIAHKMGKCQFVFFSSDPNYRSEKLCLRLELVFAKANMKLKDYCVFIPWQKKSSFYSLMKRADVFLDTIGFSGFNTAMQAIECGLPIVTREGRFMRGKLASGILRRMGVTELIANKEEEYVNLAVKLARNVEYRRNIRQHIETSSPILFNDIAPVRALEDFLFNVVKRG